MSSSTDGWRARPSKGFQSWTDEQQINAMHERVRDAKEAGVPSAVGGCVFSGAFSFGMEEAGFHVAGHLEAEGLDLGLNVARQRWPAHIGPFERMAEIASDLVQRGVEAMHFNPPCVAYAGTGKHEGTADERMCFARRCAYDVAMVAQPNIWAWELVPGIFGKDKSWLDAMAFRAGRLGYKCWAFLTSSALHGGFQDRRRFHFVASKYDLDFEGVLAREPMERRGVRTLNQALELVRKARWRADSGFPLDELQVSDKLGVLPNDSDLYTGAFREIFPHAVPGMHIRDLPDAIMEAHYRPRGIRWKPGAGLPGFAHTRGRMDRPSPNVLGGHTIVHPVEDRYLTPREKATIMGYPEDFEFSSGTLAYAEIGKGLCTHNAAFLGRVMMDGIIRAQRVVSDRQLHVVDWRARAKSLSLTPTVAEARAWYEMRHGTPPPDGYGGKRRFQSDEDEVES